MDKIEYLMVFDGVIFGMAIVDLVSHTKNIIKKSYWEYVLWAITLFDMGALNWYSTYSRLDIITQGYEWYLLLILPMILYYVTVRYFTPDEGMSYKDYFLANSRQFMALVFLYSTSIIVVDWISGRDLGFLWERTMMLGVIALAWIVNKPWARTLYVVLRFAIIIAILSSADM